MASHSLNVCGVEVDFPFTPYPCQLVYMEKVISSLQQGTNAILESPTGTGKTLCLLCAALAWREDLIRRQRGGGPEEEREGEVWEGEDEEEEGLWDIKPSGRHSNVPKIIYASRTHSQLSQVIHELKNTKYRPRMAIIGSRDQLCIHPEVSKKETNSEKVHLCRAKVQSNSCVFYRNVDVKRLRSSHSVMDIEDLVQAGTRQRMCPYYLAREMKSEADIVFMPYNYILDIKTRKMHGIDVQGTVIILDEAHNIEKVCEDSASFDLTSTDISLCVTDVDTILKAKKEEQSLSAEEDEIGEDLEDLLNLKAFLLSVEQTLDNLDIANPYKGSVRPGKFIFDFLGAAGLTHATCPTLLDQCGKAISLLTSDSRSFRNGNNIQKFVDAVKVVFSQTGAGDPRDSSHHYKVFLKAEETKKKKSDVWTAPAAESSSKKETRTLSYWCFSPGYAMANLTAQGVRSIVLTSGTLSPLDSFSSELCIDFPIQYEGPHIVSKEQVWVGVVSRGSDGAALNSSYEKRSTSSYQTSLGNTIVNFARIVPHGVLVFFPSYPVMHSCVDFWRENGILQRIEQYKPVFLEPKRKADFNPTMDAFYENIADPKKEGAIFFAVCRGKVSEGLDFANNNGRAVIITGLPYPPKMDPKVGLKMEYLGEAQKRSHSVVLGGQEWYRQQASRAVNQAVGRVIRHRNDYGAILLCDERFAYPNTINQLPKWVRPFVHTYDKFGLIQRDLTQFFRNAEKKFGAAAPKKPSVTAQPSQAEGESSQSLRGPIVVRDPSWRKKGIVPQDASVVEMHMTSKKTGVPEASLTRLRDEEERSVGTKSLLSSLERAEAGPTPSVKQVGLHSHSEPQAHKQKGPTLSESILQSQVSDQPGPSSSAARPKKMLVVSKKQKQVKKVASIAGFIDEIQSNLSNHAYTTFKTALGAYKKKHDIYAFTESLKDIFKQPSLYHLLQGLQPFLLEEHRETFSLFYHEFTGRELGKSSLQQLSGVKRKGTATHASEPKEKAAKKTDCVRGDGNFSKGTSSSLLKTDHLLDSSSHLNHGKNHLTS